ncbi:MAG: OmpA family protein [Bacteroidales bacterium]|nr:OmpA family protein [Bacteroidales bacterium]MCF8386837.1 OmpA family protein [Bacteroidales bacterium]MCF8399255.1 OmpA family protein [Bacteroidales bacterium]
MKSGILSGTMIICFLLAGVLQAQDYELTTTSKKAARYYDRAERAYVENKLDKSREYLHRAIVEDSVFIEAWLLLGDIYMDENKPGNAEEAYRKAIGIDPEFFPHAWYFLGNIQLELKKYPQAEESFKSYLEFPDLPAVTITRVQQKLEEIRFRAEAYRNPVPFNPVNLGDTINTPADEYINALSTDEQLLFFTRRIRIDENSRTPRYQEKILFARKQDSLWSQVQDLNIDFQSNLNIGAMIISPDRNYLFFVICTSSMGLGSCDLYYAPRQYDSWGKPVNLGSIVNTGFWESQPSFSSDGRTLYFASNRPGGKGSSDIWKSTIKDGHWTKPVNLGWPVNTSKEEMAPFIHPDDKTLYYSSAGHSGMGSADLFVSRKDSTGLWGTPVNLGYPINTEEDEINLIVSPGGQQAYISSNKEGGRGNYDIYVFELYDAIKPEPVTYLKGKVFDANTLESLQASFELIDLETQQTRVESFSDKESGEFLLVIPVGQDFALNVSREGYLFYSDHFSLSEVKAKTDPYLKDIPLQPISAGERVILKNIFFELDRYDLKEESRVELKKLIEFLQNNPSLSIEISGHTDASGSDEYNKELSENRARSVYNFLVNNGIDQQRLEYKGYGEEQPIADNKTEQGRAQNRRTEFKILD